MRRVWQVTRLRCGTSRLAAHFPTVPVAGCTCGLDAVGETVPHVLLTCVLYRPMWQRRAPGLRRAWDGYVATAITSLGPGAQVPPRWDALQARPGLLLLALRGDPLLHPAALTLREQLRLHGEGPLAMRWTAWASTLAEGIGELFAI